MSVLLSFKKIRLTLKQHGFELHGSIYMQILFNKCIGNFFADFVTV